MVHDILKGADARINQHRTAQRLLRFVLGEGVPVPAGTQVAIEQTRHAFPFGCNMYGWERLDTPDQNASYSQHLADLFSYAVLEFYWGKPPGYARMDGYEPAQGDIRRDRREKQVEWCSQHGLMAKGHPLLFFREPAWVAALAEADGEAAQWSRITREIRGFAGSVAIWDVVNEPVGMQARSMEQNAPALSRLYARHGELGVIKKAYALARQADPTAILVLNDVVTDDRFLNLVAQALDAGVPIDAIGIQHHELSDYGGPERAWDICERFGRFGLPVHITELMIPSGSAAGRAAFGWQRCPAGWMTEPEGEARQAEETAELYRILFSHPAVGAITWWDFCDQSAFMELPVGLLRRDATPKPAYVALRKLIREEWWTRAQLVATGGAIPFSGFLGDYRVTAEIAGVRLQGAFSLAGPPDALIDVCLQASA